MYPNSNPTVDALGSGPRTALVLTLLLTLLVAIIRVAALVWARSGPPCRRIRDSH